VELMAGNSGLTVEAIALRRERVAQLTREGRSAVDIAALVGITKRSVVRIRSDMGLSRESSGPPMTEDERRRALDLLQDGCSYAEVARTLGRNKNVIAARWPGYSWTRTQAGEAAAMARRANRQMARLSA
jgi:DNA-binding CsgD family transcriptional regulator